MAVRGDALVVPTIEHAQAAADVLAEEGASAVLLFGSVAAGTAREGSDVDLMAVFDDIDYAERYPRRWKLEAKCSASAGVPVEVHVTDWPEWRQRTAMVSSSFEASIARQHRTLFERVPPWGAVRWGKEIGMPSSNLDEAVERLAAVRQALGEMAAACVQRNNETRTVDGIEGVVAWVRELRLRGLCADASMTIETSLQALCAANGVESERTRNTQGQFCAKSDAHGPPPAHIFTVLRQQVVDPHIQCSREGDPSPGPCSEPPRSKRDFTPRAWTPSPHQRWTPPLGTNHLALIIHENAPWCLARMLSAAWTAGSSSSGKSCRPKSQRADRVGRLAATCVGQL